MRTRARWYTDEVLRISTSRLRVEMGPAQWRKTSVVHLSADGDQATVVVKDVPSTTTYGGTRRMLECPRCRSSCTVLGVIPGAGWACRGCGGWRGRDVRRVRYGFRADTR